MEALILNALDRGTLEYGILETLICELQKYAIVIDTVHLPEVEVLPCRHCYQCWTKTPGLCVIDDMGREIAKGMLRNQVTMILSQSVDGEMPHIVKHAMGRTIANFSLTKIRDQYWNLAALGVVGQGNAALEQKYQENVRRMGIDFHCSDTTAGVIAMAEGLQSQREKIEAFVAEAFMKRNRR